MNDDIGLLLLDDHCRLQSLDDHGRLSLLDDDTARRVIVVDHGVRLNFVRVGK